MTDLVTTARHGDIAVITIDNPPLNVFSPGVPEGVAASVRDAEADDAVTAIVVTGAGRHFCAGADITTFGMPRDEAPDLRGLVDTLAAASKPVVAAIRGTAFGGGLEMAMACHWRVASGDANLGLPEVKLGLLPGAGGTQRLPRLVGLEAALGMITTGSPIDGRRGHELGLVDELADGEIVEAAVAFADRRADQAGAVRRTHDRDVTVDGDAAQILDGARRQARKRAPGVIAPQRCIDAVAAALELPFDEGIARERELFSELMASDQSRSLRHVFFAERRAAKIDDVRDDVEPIGITRGAVIGAGTMGGGIAMNFANAGIPVTVVEVDQDALDSGMAKVERNYQRTVDKGRLDAGAMQERMGRITGTTDFDAVAEADVVVEAVFEDMDLKRDVFGRLDGLAADHAVLATNTSTLDVNRIAKATSRPGAVVGMHFFSPANVMKLLEIVRGDETSDRALVTAVTLGKRMRKVPVVVGVCDGFVGNRMFHVYVHEASTLLEEGALPEQVDRVITDFGFKMGPFAVQDLAGLDVGYRIRNQQAAEQGIDADERERTIADKLVERDRLGQKSGAGFYHYGDDGRTPTPDPEVTDLIVAHSAEHDIRRREIDDQEIRDRLLGQLVNEGARILEEGIAQRASDIDVIYVYGYGFPAQRGGPMFHAGLVGLTETLGIIERFHQRHGERWEPAPLLRQLAMDGKTFDDA
jgi:3-hydroxyacyl-CoA dehydrogenase